jgi:predicted DNA-binding transcriptional regulator AlpA
MLTKENTAKKPEQEAATPVDVAKPDKKTAKTSPKGKQERKKRKSELPRGEKLRQRIAAAGLSLNDPCRLLRARDLSALLTIHEITVWNWVAEGKLPKPITFSSNTKAWRASDIAAWLDAKAKASA